MLDFFKEYFGHLEIGLLFFASFAETFGSIVMTPFEPSSRFYWLYWLTFIFFAFIAYLLYYKRNSKFQLFDFFRFCFPKKVYLHASSLVDYQLYIANRFFFSILFFLSWDLAFFVTYKTYLNLVQLFGPAPVLFSWNGWTILAVTFLVALINDFAAFFNHTLHHFSSVLWPFHSVHHSAEVLNPFTLDRQHPIYKILSVQVKGILRGLFQGSLLYFFLSEAPTYFFLLKVNAVYALFHLMGVHLRHSHIWFSYGPVLSYFLISPAQHQIHHSVALEHRNKNMGEIFAIWDWMFGTLYIPKTKEELVFGIDRDQPQIHPTLWRAYVEPFESAWRALCKLLFRSS